MNKTIAIFLILLVFAFGACTQAGITSPTGIPASVEEDTDTQTDAQPSVLPATVSPTPTELQPSLTASASPTAIATAPPDLLADYPKTGYGPTNFPKGINPLTGLPVTDPEILDRRPLAVKISNGPRGIRPQWGLSFADHVIEYYQEAERTRFNAIFYGHDASTAGPIRSARFVDEHIIRMYKSFFAFGSADARVLERLYGTELSERFASISDAACPPTTDFPLCRTEPVGKNHLITDTTVLRQHFDQKGVDSSQQTLIGLFFQAVPPESGSTPGNSLTLRYSKSFYNRWEYDPAYNKYVRYQDASIDYSGGSGEQYTILTDRLTGEPIRADNVVVIIAEYIPFLENPEIWEINLLGEGQAYLFRDGNVYDITWSRNNDGDLFALTSAEGDLIPLRPGSTWFQIIGQSSRLTIDGVNWRFEHKMP